MPASDSNSVMSCVFPRKCVGGVGVGVADGGVTCSFLLPFGIHNGEAEMQQARSESVGAYFAQTDNGTWDSSYMA